MPEGIDQRELDDAALEALAEAYAAAPPPGLRARVLDTAALGDATRARRRWRAAGAIAATLALALGGLLARETGLRARELARLEAQQRQLAALAGRNAELTARVETQERTLAGLQASLDTQARVLRILGAPRTVSASLSAQPGFAGSGRVHVDAESGEGAVVLSGVRGLAPDQVYELWALRGNAPPEPAGLLSGAGPSVYLSQIAKLPRPAGVTAFAVSIEPAGGSERPTGPIVLTGAVTG